MNKRLNPHGASCVLSSTIITRFADWARTLICSLFRLPTQYAFLFIITANCDAYYIIIRLSIINRYFSWSYDIASSSLLHTSASWTAIPVFHRYSIWNLSGIIWPSNMGNGTKTRAWKDFPLQDTSGGTRYYSEIKFIITCLIWSKTIFLWFEGGCFDVISNTLLSAKNLVNQI